MITKNTKDIITILKWLQTNASTKVDQRENLEKIKISRDEETVTLETSNGFSHTRAVISGIDKHPNDLFLTDLPLPGIYTMTLLSHGTVEWEEFIGRDFPDVSNLYPQSPKFLITEPYTNFSVVCGIDPSRFAKILPQFIKPIQLCMNGAMLGIQGKCNIDDDKYSVMVTGLLMPMHIELDEYIFGGQSAKIYKQSNGSGWLEILQPEPELQPVIEADPELAMR
jgi:hypothetical protein